MADDFDKTILERVAHRPWKMPDGPWLMTQTWLDLLFAHWAVAVDDVRSLVPQPFEIDTSRNTHGSGYKLLRWVPRLLCRTDMEQKKPNQERRRKYGGSSSFVDVGQPSRAPRQDEEGAEAVGSDKHEPGLADGQSALQGISNRPAKEEHAFPESGGVDPESAASDSVDTDSKQVGGNRGRV
jgi:hypothetical protein